MTEATMPTDHLLPTLDGHGQEHALDTTSLLALLRAQQQVATRARLAQLMSPALMGPASMSPALMSGVGAHAAGA